MTTTLISAFLINWGRVAAVSAVFFDTAALLESAADGADCGADAVTWFSRLAEGAAPPVLEGEFAQLGKAMVEDKVKNATTAKRVLLLFARFGLCGGELVLR
ncbi:hypothetical protein QT971_18530 [Microcoleus sp. herbarium19]|uniref:hypothetical protein n=1 Tax=unclassified Microcoleus TaxID=2642155 RepID=UPI002FCF65EB